MVFASPVVIVQGILAWSWELANAIGMIKHLMGWSLVMMVVHKLCWGDVHKPYVGVLMGVVGVVLGVHKPCWDGLVSS